MFDDDAVGVRGAGRARGRTEWAGWASGAGRRCWATGRVARGVPGSEEDGRSERHPPDARAQRPGSQAERVAGVVSLRGRGAGHPRAAERARAAPGPRGRRDGPGGLGQRRVHGRARAAAGVPGALRGGRRGRGRPADPPVDPAALLAALGRRLARLADPRAGAHARVREPGQRPAQRRPLGRRDRGSASRGAVLAETCHRVVQADTRRTLEGAHDFYWVQRPLSAPRLHAGPGTAAGGGNADLPAVGPALFAAFVTKLHEAICEFGDAVHGVKRRPSRPAELVVRRQTGRLPRMPLRF
mmetsp:Transcript_72563/g.222217  ORF Transcript_72563/g.222217 Transcript_72563/m.222217 type:complete len:299 (-) Transcript_72563:628-1524(-)